VTPDAPMFAAADRNKDVILDVLRDVLPPTGGVLEIASGGGQHVFHFSAGNLDAVISANMIHIAPWSACVGLMEGAARLLAPGGLVYFYGPFIVDGKFSSEGNKSFDRSLRAENPEWGLRHLEELCGLAQSAGFVLDQTIEMPVNNLSVLFRRVAAKYL